MQKRTIFYILTLCAVLYFCISLSTEVFAKHTGELRVAFLDIGQGDSIYIEAPNGNQMIIDGARSENLLLPQLKKVMPIGDTSIDVVLATHPDADHIGGLPAVIDSYTVGMFVEPGMQSSTKVYQSLIGAVETKYIPHTYARTGTVITLDKENNVTFSVLSPVDIAQLKETNPASIVGMLSYGSKKFLLTGDAPTEVEQRILKNNSNIHADILKLGHHGSRTSSGENFLRAVSPQTAIISAGCNNTYGHPHKEVIALLTKLSIPSLSTCSHGTIEYDTDGVVVTMKTEK